MKFDSECSSCRSRPSVYIRAETVSRTIGGHPGITLYLYAMAWASITAGPPGRRAWLCLMVQRLLGKAGGLGNFRGAAHKRDLPIPEIPE